jgi:hypothetical protein
MVSQPEKDRAPLKLCTLTRVNIEHSILRQEKKHLQLQMMPT